MLKAKNYNLKAMRSVRNSTPTPYSKPGSKISADETWVSTDDFSRLFDYVGEGFN